MTEHQPTPRNELEETVQGYELFRAPGSDLHIEAAREAAEAGGWLPPDVVFDWPTVETHLQVVNRRQELYDAMRRLEASVARASGQEDWASMVNDAVSHLLSALERHVAQIEGPNGLFTEVIDRAPHLGADVDRLRREHRSLISNCRRALEMTRERNTDVAEIRRQALAILGRLAVHRQRGSELLFDTYNVDLAAAN